MMIFLIIIFVLAYIIVGLGFALYIHETETPPTPVVVSFGLLWLPILLFFLGINLAEWVSGKAHNI